VSVGIRDLLDAVVSEAQRLGVFDRFAQHEPKSAPGQGLTWACWVQRVDPIRGSGLDSTSARIVFTIRLYSSWSEEPVDEIDPTMIEAADLLTAAYCGNFTLDIAEVRMVDIKGAYDIPLAWEAGYLNVGGGMYRILDITLPLVINDVWTEAP
jgi:hypothetical protein